MHGTIKFYNNEKGFGFIFTDEVVDDVYFHVNDWKNASVPCGNDDVEFELSKSQNGKSKAINIILSKSSSDKRQENFAKNDDRVICLGCNKKIVPRIITHYGKPINSLCPYCGTEVKKFSACFIATAVYEDYNHPNVIILRNFRDNYLLTNSIGSKFVQFYYRYSPKIANYIKDKKIFLYPIKRFLDLLIFLFAK